MINNLKSNLKEFWHNFNKSIRRAEMAILPGQLAFFFVLAIVPTITLISYGAASLNLSTDLIFDFIGKSFSKEIAEMLLATSNDIHGFSFILLIIVAYFLASNGPASIITTSNAIYGEKHNPFIRRRIKALIMTFILILLFLFMLIIPIFGDRIILLFRYVNMNANVTEMVEKVIKILNGPITWLIMYLFIKLLYTIAPNRSVLSKSVGYGALFTTISWILITYIYSYYINHIAIYSTFYGGLANIVVLMIWIYFLALVFTIGMALNYCKEEKLSETGTIKINKE